MKRNVYFLLAMLAFFLCALDSYAQELSVWSTNVHAKIFADTQPEPANCVSLFSASNEYESGQIALRSSSNINNLNIICSPLECAQNKEIIDAANVRIRRIGMLPISKNTPGAEEIVVRKAPCDIPDILYNESVVNLKANETVGIWLTVFVPKGTKAGKYQGVVSIKNEEINATLPIELNVYPFELPDARHLLMTNWWSVSNITAYHNVRYLSEEYWNIVEKYFKNMAEHRQNVILLQWVPGSNNSIKCIRKENGTLEFDFTNLERIIQLAEQYGVADRLEFGHLGGIDRTKHVVNFRSTDAFDEKEGKIVNLSFEEWFEPSLKAFYEYLKKTDRLQRALIHISDEPFQPDIDAWRDASKRVRKIAPELKQIDAIETMNFTDCLDVWVPKLSHFDRWRKGFEERRDNNEFWYYICCHPVGTTYPNRFIDLPAARIRVLHWINYSEELTGYLHWGYNFWQGNAFGAPTEQYGPGDTHIVYPSPDGLLDSIRWELERESVEDYEYLKLLEESVAQFKKQLNQDKAWAIDPKGRAMELAKKIVPELSRTTLDANLIEQTRQELAQEIICATSDPKLIVQTFPEDGKTIYSGPNIIELYGVTSPGAKVIINDKEIPVDEEGFFKSLYHVNTKGDFILTISASLEDKSVKTERRFTIK